MPIILTSSNPRMSWTRCSRCLGLHRQAWACHWKHLRLCSHPSCASCDWVGVATSLVLICFKYASVSRFQQNLDSMKLLHAPAPLSRTHQLKLFSWQKLPWQFPLLVETTVAILGSPESYITLGDCATCCMMPVLISFTLRRLLDLDFGCQKAIKSQHISSACKASRFLAIMKHA